MKIKLIYPKWRKLERQTEFHLPPHSPVVFAASLPPEVEVQFTDENVDVLNTEDSPDLVAISILLTAQLPRAMAIAGHYRSRGIPVLALTATATPRVKDDIVRLALAEATVREGKKVADWNVCVEVATRAVALDASALLAKARSAEIEARVRAATAAFHALQVTQRPTFVLESGIGDRVVFSGVWRPAPLVVAVESLLADAVGRNWGIDEEALPKRPYKIALMYVDGPGDERRLGAEGNRHRVHAFEACAILNIPLFRQILSPGHNLTELHRMYTRILSLPHIFSFEPRSFY